jgi:hypothetical protein
MCDKWVRKEMHTEFWWGILNGPIGAPGRREGGNTKK